MGLPFPLTPAGGGRILPASIIREMTPTSTNMTTTSDQLVTNYEQHQLEMLLWQAHIHEKNGKRQEAAKIREWVADLLSEQSKVIRSVGRRLPTNQAEPPSMHFAR